MIWCWRLSTFFNWQDLICYLESCIFKENFHNLREISIVSFGSNFLYPSIWSMLWFNSDWGLLFILCLHDLSRDESRWLTSPSKVASGHAWPFATIGVITKLEASVFGTYKIVVSCWIFPFFIMCWLSLSLRNSFVLQYTLFHIRIVTPAYFQVFSPHTLYTCFHPLTLSLWMSLPMFLGDSR